MYVAKWNEVDATTVSETGAKGVSIRVLMSENVGAQNFAMRRYEVSQGGSTPYHAHPWEHEVFVLSGKGSVRHQGGETDLEVGSFVFVAPSEEHAFQNAGSAPFVFLCVIPRSKVRTR